MSFFGKKLEAAEATIARLGSVLAVFGLKPEATVEEANARLAAIGTDAVNAAAGTHEEALGAARADLESARAQVGIFRTALGYPETGEITADALQAHVATRTSAAAAKIVAGAGHDPLPVAAGDTSATGGADSLEEVREQLRAETDPRKAGELAARAAKLRAEAGRN